MARFSIRAMVGTRPRHSQHWAVHAHDTRWPRPRPARRHRPHRLHRFRRRDHKVHRAGWSHRRKDDTGNINGRSRRRARRQLGRNHHSCGIFWFSASRHPRLATPKRFRHAANWDSRVKGLELQLVPSSRKRAQRPSIADQIGFSRTPSKCAMSLIRTCRARGTAEATRAAPAAAIALQAAQPMLRKGVAGGAPLRNLGNKNSSNYPCLIHVADRF